VFCERERNKLDNEGIVFTRGIFGSLIQAQENKKAGIKK
jgi:hypothetical protein